MRGFFVAVIIVFSLLSLCFSFCHVFTQSTRRLQRSVQMRYGWACPGILFGWEEPNNQCILDQTWLEKYDLMAAADEISKNRSRLPVYGIACSLDPTTGQAILEPFERERVEKAYNFIVEYYKQEKIKPPELSYQSVISASDMMTFWNLRYPDEKYRYVYYPKLVGQIDTDSPAEDVESINQVTDEDNAE